MFLCSSYTERRLVFYLGLFYVLALSFADSGPAPDACSRLTNPANGKVGDHHTSYLFVAVYSCNEGYSLFGDKQRVCTAGGSWSGVTPSCKKNCEYLEDPPNGYVLDNSNVYGSVAKYICNGGYELVGNTLRECIEDGDWSGTRPSCQPQDAEVCRRLTNPANGWVGYHHTSFLSVAQYSCYEGYSLVGDTYRGCTVDGSWTGVMPSCKRNCDYLEDPPNGYVQDNSNAYGAVAKYICNGGYEIVGNGTRECIRGGDWSGTEPSCQPQESCEYLEDPPNGYVQDSSNAIGSVAKYICNGGYEIVGNGTRECIGDGYWSGTEPSCQPQASGECSKLTNPANGYVGDHHTTYLSVAAYTCVGGYSLVGDKQRVCQAGGSWSGMMPSCKQNCEYLEDPPNGYVEDNSNAYGAVAKYICNGGYKLVGNALRECIEDGDWSGTEPSCQAQDPTLGPR